MTHDGAGRAECNRRQVLRGLAAAGLAATAGCGRGKRHELRAGFLTNLTHAVPMTVDRRGKLPAALGRKVVMVPFSAGPSLVEALFAGDLDLGWCGPGPAINAYVRSEGRVRIVASSTYGGAALVVRSELPVMKPSSLKRARIASPQIGNTQDISLREWLARNDLVSTDRGGTVQVLPMAPPDILSLFRAKELDAAWVAEPWVSRLIDEGGGRVFVDEATIHRGGIYPTTLLVVTSMLLRERPQVVEACARENAATVAWISNNGGAARELVNEELEKHTGKPLKPEVMSSAWARLSFGTDPLLHSLRESAVTARRLGYLPHADISGIVVEPAEWKRRQKKEKRR